MAWLAVNKNGTELVCDREPYLEWDSFWSCISDNVSIPSGTIEKILGRKLTWEDKPVELV